MSAPLSKMRKFKPDMQISSPILFSSLEEVNAFPHGWDTEFYALKAGLDGFRMERQEGAATVLTVGHFRGPTLQLGSTPSGMQTFAIPQQSDGSLIWHRKSSNINSLLTFGNDRELHSTSDGPVSICTISIALSALQDLSGSAGLEYSSGVARVTHLASDELNNVYENYLQLAKFLAEADQRQPDFALRQSTLEEGLQLALLQASQPSNASFAMSKAKSYKILYRALEYIVAHLERPLRITALAKDLGISVRSLELCFQKHLGVPPKRVINQLRLSVARRDLLKASPAEQSVTAIAERRGFWHLGQFSADYRRAFGESPSESLARGTFHLMVNAPTSSG